MKAYRDFISPSLWEGALAVTTGYKNNFRGWAELTVALKLNQGGANGRKSLALCFSLLLSFAQAKESK